MTVTFRLKFFLGGEKEGIVPRPRAGVVHVLVREPEGASAARLLRRLAVLLLGCG